jgi:hypothetical protein
MAAHAQLAPIEETMPRQKFFNKLSKADLQERMKSSLRQSLHALLDGYDEDKDDPHRVEPSLQSFGRMMAFLSHPHHQLWVPPAIGLNAQGLFVAVWQEPGVFRWVLDFAPNGDIDETYLEFDVEGGLRDTSRKTQVGGYHTPPFPEAKIL